jgi:hypothetical protein
MESPVQAHGAFSAPKVGVKQGVCGSTMRARQRDKEVDSVSNGYNGKIKNSGTQEVKAPNSARSSTKTATVHRGTDLRTKGKK